MPLSESAGGRDIADEFKDALEQHLGTERFSMWWNDEFGVTLDGEGVTIEVAQPFLLERLRSRLLSDLKKAAEIAVGAPTSLSLKLISVEQSESPNVEPVKPLRTKKTSAAESKAANGRTDHTGTGATFQSVPSSQSPQQTLRQKTMADFLVGSNNQLAAAAAQLISRQPGAASPLYLHGPTGSGKSHLLEGIRHQLRHDRNMRRVILMTAEEFTNDFMGALNGSGLPGFRRRYRDVETLLVDDIQFLDGKRATIREFQFTVDSLIRSGKQLVFTADRPPLELDGIGGELAGRLAGGMVCGLGPLDAKTRGQLIQKVASEQQIEFARGVIEFAAERLPGDGRLVSGFVCRLKAVAEITQAAITEQDVRQYAADLLDSGVQTVGLLDIQKAVCETFGLPANALQSRGQNQALSQPRMLAMYLARRYTRAALSEIGVFFGDRSHSTVIASDKRVQKWLDEGSTVRRSNRSVDINGALQTIQRQLRVS